MCTSTGTKSFIPGLIASLIVGVCCSGQTWPVVTCGEASSSKRAEPLVLTYVANAGVLVASGESKVLVDALFNKPDPEYRPPSRDILDKIMTGAAPFDGVDLVLVTHNHADHFDARLAVRYLEDRPEPLLLGPADAVEEMRKIATDWKKIEPRVVPLDLKIGEKVKRNLKRIPVTAFRTPHSGERESPMNVMYLFELAGWRVFHEGDSTGKPEVYQGFKLGDAPVDLALVHFWFPLDPNCARFLQEALKPDHIALTHLPIRLEGDAPGKIDLVKKYYKDLFLLLPGMSPRAFRAWSARAEISEAREVQIYVLFAFQGLLQGRKLALFPGLTLSCARRSSSSSFFSL